VLDQQEPAEQQQAEARYLRFTVSDRVEHWLQVITFVVLAFTGLIQKWPQAGFSEFSIQLLGGIETTRIIHRIFATILLLAVVYHLYTAGVKIFVRKARRTMIPGPADLKAAWHGLLFNLGLRDERPAQGHFTWEEKIEYWAIVWGTLVMTVTGFMLWNPIATARFLPGQFIPAAKAAHGGEALLAVLAILVWHFYHVHIRSFNTSIFTGYLSRHHMEEEHASELAEIETGTLPPEAPAEDQRSRMKLFLPVYAVIAALLLIGIYLFVTIEETAITTIEPAETVNVFVPAPTPTVPLDTTTTTEPVEETTTTTQPEETTTTTEPPAGDAPSWDTGVAVLFTDSCGACHSGSGGLGGLDVSSYEGILAGGESGPGIVPGDPDASVVYTLQMEGGHAGQFDDDQLATVLEWIETGAPESADASAGGADEPSWNGLWAGIMDDACGACHSGSGGLGGLDVSSYEGILAGGESGPGIVPGDPDASVVYTLQMEGGHPGQLTDEQLAELANWIDAGAIEG
jgi:cytochrome b subunit of formate dehydrogenase/mono/diheme cytochrome c family protein